MGRSLGSEAQDLILQDKAIKEYSQMAHTIMYKIVIMLRQIESNNQKITDCLATYIEEF